MLAMWKKVNHGKEPHLHDVADKEHVDSPVIGT